MESPVLVRIDFARVQTFLFAVPRLRDMVGANVLLGETLRAELTELADEIAEGRSPWPAGIDIDALELPTSQEDDPLNGAGDADKDDPPALYRKGILARDGGHFYAVFADQATAERFATAAEQMLAQRLPGLRFTIKTSAFGSRGEPKSRGAQAQAVLDLPQWQVCEASGNGPAEARDPPQGDDAEWISQDVIGRRKAYKQFRDATTRDIIGLLRGALPTSKVPPDFHALCAGDYFAVLHADGNHIGDRSDEARGPKPDDERSVADALAAEARGEKFFHSSRLAVRKAVKQALGAAFGNPLDARKWGSYQPYQLLMLGGDDLLLVCRAKAVMRFLIAYARALESQPLADGKPLTVGAGVVVAPPNLPFHRLHHLAEELAGSAKRLARCHADAGTPISTVDWIVNTGSWVDDPVALRRRDEVVRYEVANQTETLALSRRPLPILGAGLASLEGLHEAAEQLNQPERNVPRTPLRRAAGALGGGRRWGQLVFDDLPQNVKAALENEKVGIARPWIEAGEGRWTTPLVDLIELREIKHLSTARQPAERERRDGQTLPA